MIFYILCMKEIKARYCSFVETFTIPTCFGVCYLPVAPKLDFWRISWHIILFDRNRCARASYKSI